MQTQQLFRLLAEKILTVKSSPVRVALDGIDAAGKTTLADSLVPPLEKAGRSVIRASIDGFHNPHAMRYQRGADSPAGYYHDSFNLDAVKSVLLIPLAQGQAYRTAIFDFRTDSPLDVPAKIAPSDSILLFDGVFLLRPELRDCWDFKIFLDISFDESLKRALKRDMALFGSAQNIEARYRQRYIPAQQLYFAHSQPKQAADILINNQNPLNPEIIAP